MAIWAIPSPRRISSMCSWSESSASMQINSLSGRENAYFKRLHAPLLAPFRDNAQEIYHADAAVIVEVMRGVESRISCACAKCPAQNNKVSHANSAIIVDVLSNRNACRSSGEGVGIWASYDSMVDVGEISPYGMRFWSDIGEGIRAIEIQISDFSQLVKLEVDMVNVGESAILIRDRHRASRNRGAVCRREDVEGGACWQ